jgi:Zn-dependent peptidase ImmA (M78 family)
MLDAGEQLGELMLKESRRIPVEDLSELLDIDLEYVPSKEFHATIAPRGQRLVITISATHSEPRRRASIAHEIGHTFFFDLDSSRRRPIVTYPPGDKRSVAMEEHACWLFARALLMPRLGLERCGVPETELTALGIWRHAGRFGVSTDLFAERLLVDCDFYPWHSYRERRPKYSRKIRSHNGRWIREKVTVRHRFLRQLNQMLTQGPLADQPAAQAILEKADVLYTSKALDRDGQGEFYWISFESWWKKESSP